MTKIKVSFYIILVWACFVACEKDDICVEGDTPLLVIRFYDADNPTEFKAVSSLRVVGVGKDTTVNSIADRTALDSIGLPLRINQPNTGFLFIVDSASDENDLEIGNIDTLTFAYETKEIFISRACGFIPNFENLSNTLTTDPENWIQSIEIDTTLVENSASAHVKIFH